MLRKTAREEEDVGERGGALEAKLAQCCLLHRDALGALQGVDDDLLHNDGALGRAAKERHKEAPHKRTQGQGARGAEEPRPEARRCLHVCDRNDAFRQEADEINQLSDESPK